MYAPGCFDILNNLCFFLLLYYYSKIQQLHFTLMIFQYDTKYNPIQFQFPFPFPFDFFFFPDQQVNRILTIEMPTTDRILFRVQDPKPTRRNRWIISNEDIANALKCAIEK